MEISGGGGGEKKREPGQQMRQKVVGSTELLYLLGFLRALIWELSEAFVCFSSAGSPGLRGN